MSEISTVPEAEDLRAAASVWWLTVVIGLFLIRHPVHGVTAVAILVGITLIANGVALAAAGLVLHRALEELR